MTVELKDIRKTAVIGWDTEVATGTHVSIHAAGEEVRTGDNDGEANLYFPMGFEGEVKVEVRGSADGTDEGVITVS